MACALFLLALPAALVATAPPAAARPQNDLGAQLEKHTHAAQQSRQVLRFFETHRWLLSDPRFAVEARRQLERHTGLLATATKKVEATRAAIARRNRVEANRKARMLAAVKAKDAATARRAAEQARPTGPREAICRVFGEYCGEALRVAHCESRLQTDARNGQYLGLFQMGSSERTLFGHGTTAFEQATAAHRYFVRSGRDWSPWSCKP